MHRPGRAPRCSVRTPPCSGRTPRCSGRTPRCCERTARSRARYDRRSVPSMRVPPRIELSHANPHGNATSATIPTHVGDNPANGRGLTKMGDKLDHIRSYYAALDTGDPDEVARHFTDDAVHYYTRLGPHEGARTIGEH